MTPLAHRVTRELFIPIAQRGLLDWTNCLAKEWDDIHCFDISEVLELCQDIANKMTDDAPKDLLFLPAPRTWIEWTEGGRREGFLVQADATGETATIISIQEVPEIKVNKHPIIEVSSCKLLIGLRANMSMSEAYVLQGIPDRHALFADLGDTEKKHLEEVKDFLIDYGHQWVRRLAGALTLINTPKIIGRTTHMPHAGLQRDMAKKRGMVGKFPLHAWTEINLRVRVPLVDEKDQEIFLSGSRALHFCRSHVRFRLGRLELVRSHWRGDPALGIKQTRYKVTK